MRGRMLGLLMLPALLVAPASLCAQSAGSISLGAGLGFGVRLGVTAHARVFVAENVAVGCAASGAFRMLGRSCGAYLFPEGGAAHFGIEAGRIAYAPLRGAGAAEEDSLAALRALDHYFLAGVWGGAWKWRRVTEVGFRAAAGPALILLERETRWSGSHWRPGADAEREWSFLFLPLWALDLSAELHPLRR